MLGEAAEDSAKAFGDSVDGPWRGFSQERFQLREDLLDCQDQSARRPHLAPDVEHRAGARHGREGGGRIYEAKRFGRSNSAFVAAVVTALA